MSASQPTQSISCSQIKIINSEEPFVFSWDQNALNFNKRKDVLVRGGVVTNSINLFI